MCPARFFRSVAGALDVVGGRDVGCVRYTSTKNSAMPRLRLRRRQRNNGNPQTFVGSASVASWGASWEREWTPSLA